MNPLSSVKPIPEGYHTVTPYLVADEAARLLSFLEAAFDAKVLFRSLRESGEIGHAEVQIGDSRLMLSGTQPQWPALPCALYLYVEDCDALYAQAIAAGAKSIMEPANMFYGDRHGGVIDPSGNQWWIATHVEDVSHEEIARRDAERSKAG
ncbi:MAG TPA: VOC family protein [Thermoanaerobaculia bacterium]|jgi:PhnB protein|nr:VOC family protein [Thermoanaerobaculia bacterium]